MSSGDEAALLQAVAQGDEEALIQLYDRYSRQAFGLAYRILGDATTAEEVVQDAFLALWQHARTLTVRGGSVRAWLLTVVRNRAIDLLRRRRGQPQLLHLDAVTMPLAPSETMEEALDGLEQSAVLQALASLPPEQRQIIELAYFAGLTHQEIATSLGIPLGTVKSRLRLALERLGRAFEQQGSGAH